MASAATPLTRMQAPPRMHAGEELQQHKGSGGQGSVEAELTCPMQKRGRMSVPSRAMDWISGSLRSCELCGRAHMQGRPATRCAPCTHRRRSPAVAGHMAQRNGLSSHLHSDVGAGPPAGRGRNRVKQVGPQASHGQVEVGEGAKLPLVPLPHCAHTRETGPSRRPQVNESAELPLQLVPLPHCAHTRETGPSRRPQVNESAELPLQLVPLSQCEDDHVRLGDPGVLAGTPDEGPRIVS